jgi:hypothetical protein
MAIPGLSRHIIPRRGTYPKFVIKPRYENVAVLGGQKIKFCENAKWKQRIIYLYWEVFFSLSNEEE